MQILVSEEAHEQFGGLLRTAAPDAAFVCATPETLRLDGQPVEAHALQPEVAWFSNDLFGGGQGAGWFVTLFAGSPNLRWLQSSTAGLDNPLFSKLANAGVKVTGAHIYGTPVAEFVMRAVLDHFQAAAEWREAQQGARWTPTDFREVDGSTWVIVGMGAIGREISRRAMAFGATVIGVDIAPGGEEFAHETVDPTGLPAVLPRADVVSLAIPAAAGSPPLVDAGFLARMRRDALLVNTARGALVDENALIAALDRGDLGGAVLDVFEEEPLPAGHPLWAHPRVAVTPHVAGQGQGRYRRGAEVFAANLRRYVADEPLLSQMSTSS